MFFFTKLQNPTVFKATKLPGQCFPPLLRSKKILYNHSNLLNNTYLGQTVISGTELNLQEKPTH